MAFFGKKSSAGKNAGTLSARSALFCALGILPFAVGFSGCSSAPELPSSGGVSVPAAGTAETDFAARQAAFRSRVAELVAQGADDAGLPEDVFDSENLGAYADFLIGEVLRKGVPESDAELPISALLLAFAQEKRGAHSRALKAFSDIVYLFPDSDFAAEALYRQGEIYASRRQFGAAFDCFSALEDSFPASPRTDDAVVQAYFVTEAVRRGVRQLKGGWLPWFKDRTMALGFYDRLYQMAPHAGISPRLLYHKGMLAFDLSKDWFSFDKTLDAIDAFERMISIYPDAAFVPDAYLELARTYEAGVVGADWDQLSTRRAISYYTDFYSLFPEHPQAEYAYEKTVELTNLLAANRLAFGDFYYSRHNNLRAAVTFYNEAVTLAPDSPAGKSAQDRIARIRRGERAERTWVDWLFGRYPNYDAVDYLDAPSLRPLDQMGFRSGGNAEENGNAAASQSNGGYENPGDD